MPQLDSKSIAAQFGRLADLLDGYAHSAKKPTHLIVNLAQLGVQAGRLLQAAADAGAFDGDAWWRDGKAPIAVCASESNPGRFRLLWTFAIGSWLVKRYPERFREHAGGWDWSVLATDKDGHPVDKQGNPLRSRWYRDGEPLPEDWQGNPLDPAFWDTHEGERYQLRLEGELAERTDFYDDPDAMEHLRIRAEVYSDACRLLAELIADANDAKLADGPAQRDDPAHVESAGRARTGGRMKRAVAEPLIAKHLTKRPHDTAAQVSEKVGCSVGVVGESLAWKANQERLRIAKIEGTDPTAVKLNEQAITAVGGGKRAQLHDHQQQAGRVDDEIDARDQELLRQIGEYLAKYPDATSEQTASALRDLGCTAADVERRQAALNQLASEQADEQQEDIDVEDPNTKRGTRRKWVAKRP